MCDTCNGIYRAHNNYYALLYRLVVLQLQGSCTISSLVPLPGCFVSLLSLPCSVGCLDVGERFFSFSWSDGVSP